MVRKERVGDDESIADTNADTLLSNLVHCKQSHLRKKGLHVWKAVLLNMHPKF